MSQGGNGEIWIDLYATMSEHSLCRTRPTLTINKIKSHLKEAEARNRGTQSRLGGSMT